MRPRHLVPAILLALVSVLAVPSTALAGATVTASDRTGLELLAEGILHERTNDARTSGRLPGGAAYGDVRATSPLEGWTDLLTVARRWSDRLDFDTLRHNPDYLDQYGNWRSAGENVATVIVGREGDLDAAAVTAAAERLAEIWWDSTGHRRLWMQPGMDHVGIGAELELETLDRGKRWVLSSTANFRDHDGTTIRGAFAYDASRSRMPPQEGGSATRFRDVPSWHLFHDEIERLARAGVTSGCGDGRYCPDDIVTRGQMAAFLERALGLRPGRARFSDVPSSHTFRAPIAALADAGITSGCGGSRFCPEDPVTRDQMAAFLTRALGLPSGSARFVDVPSDHLFRQPIGALARSNITTGCGGDRFCPSQPVTRGQMAAFLDRAGLLD